MFTGGRGKIREKPASEGGEFIRNEETFKYDVIDTYFSLLYIWLIVIVVSW